MPGRLHLEHRLAVCAPARASSSDRAQVFDQIALATRPTDPEQESASRELAALLSRAIDALPAQYRMVYVLREVEDLSTREVAECLDLAEGTVKTRLHRARAMLRESLYRDGGAWAKQTFTFGGERCDALVAQVLGALAAGST